jgi:hypothetical protein
MSSQFRRISQNYADLRALQLFSLLSGVLPTINTMWGAKLEIIAAEALARRV